MKVFRFMSMKEFEEYQVGNVLFNDKDHKKSGRTDSIGFCFMNYDEEIPELAYEYLSGIVSNDVCAVFEVDKSYLTESYGVYADPYGDFFDTRTKVEYCCQSYSKDNFKLLSYAFDVYNDFNWIKTV